MQKRVLSLLPILCLSLGLLPAGALAAGTQTVKTAVTVDYGAAIEAVEYLNQLRWEAGLHDLVMDENLVKSAITRTSECSVYYSHTRPSGEGYPTACPSDSRYPSSTYSENILWGTAKVSPERATQTWRDSPLHYANMMDKSHQSVGIACVYARDGKSYWVQTFSSATAEVDPNPLTGTANLTFSVPVAPEMITPHVENSSYTVQMHAPQDVFVFNDKSPVVPDILRSADESVVKVSLAETAVSEGVATIYATTADGKASGSCRVTVSNPSQGSHSFTDVSQSDYFYDAVMWCADEGLLDDARQYGGGLHPLHPCRNGVPSVAAGRFSRAHHLHQRLFGPFFPVHPGAESHPLGRGGKHCQRHQHHHLLSQHGAHPGPGIHLPLSVLQLIVFIPEAAASGIFLSGKGGNSSKFLENSELLAKGLASSLFSGIIAELIKKERLPGNFLPEKPV